MMKSLLAVAVAVTLSASAFGQCAVVGGGYQSAPVQFSTVAYVAQLVQVVRQVRVVQQHQAVYNGGYQAFAVQQNFNQGRFRNSGFGGGYQSFNQGFQQQRGFGGGFARQSQGFGGGNNGNVLNTLLSPQSVLSIAGAAGGAAVGGPGGAVGGAAIGSALGNIIGSGLR